MKRGPKFIVTEEMAVENIKTVCARLKVTHLSYRAYMRHGSFGVANLSRKFGWARLCDLAGVTTGKRKAPRRICADCERRESIRTYCKACLQRMRRWARRS